MVVNRGCTRLSAQYISKTGEIPARLLPLTRMRYHHAIAVITLVLFFHLLGMLGLYSWHPYDIPMHFGGGVAMGVLALAMWDTHVKSVTLNAKHALAKRLFFTVWIVGFVAIIGIAWEWFEYTLDAIAEVRYAWGLAQTSLLDTMADFFFDLLGGLLVTVLRRKV